MLALCYRTNYRDIIISETYPSQKDKLSNASSGVMEVIHEAEWNSKLPEAGGREAWAVVSNGDTVSAGKMQSSEDGVGEGRTV